MSLILVFRAFTGNDPGWQVPSPPFPWRVSLPATLYVPPDREKSEKDERSLYSTICHREMAYGDTPSGDTSGSLVRLVQRIDERVSSKNGLGRKCPGLSGLGAPGETSRGRKQPLQTADREILAQTEIAVVIDQIIGLGDRHDGSLWVSGGYLLCIRESA